MTPEHHEERLRMWAVRTGKPVLSIEYGKAPECKPSRAISRDDDTHAVMQIRTPSPSMNALTFIERLWSLLVRSLACLVLRWILSSLETLRK